METPEWLKTASLNSDISEEEIIENLYALIQKTKKVCNIETLKQDMENKNKIVSPYFDENTYFCNTRSLSVKGFCAAVIKLADNRKYCISAWKDFSEESLSNLYKLSKYLQISEKKIKEGGSIRP